MQSYFTLYNDNNCSENISFEKSEEEISSENRSSRNYAPEAMTVDHRKGLFPAVLFWMSTGAKTIKQALSDTKTLLLPKENVNEFGFKSPLDLGATFITLMKHIHPYLQMIRLFPKI